MNVYRRKNGRYTAAHVDPTTGKRKTRTFRTKREGVTWLHERKADIARGEYLAPSSLTVAEALEAWHEGVARAGSLKQSTLDVYRSDIDRHLIPRIGSTRLIDLTTGLIEQKVIQAMHSEGLSPPTIRRATVPLGRALKRAVRDGIIRSNPAAAIDWREVLPKRQRRPGATYVESELVRMIEAAPDDRAQTFLGLVVGHGLRIGEALGLRRRDLGERSVEVAQQVYKGRVGPPKSEHSVRVVPTLPDYVAHLDEARRLCAGRDEDALVFTTARGGPLDPSWSRRAWLTPAQEAAGLPRAGWHALRRSYALMLAERGIALVDARDLMGHSNTATTADIYQRSGSAEAAFVRLARAVGA